MPFPRICLLFLLVVSIAIFMTPTSTHAAVFSFDPADLHNKGRAYQPGFTFNVKFVLDTEGVKVGVAGGIVLFSSDNVEVINISTERSIFSLWIHEPRLTPNTNIIEFVGGIPGGFSGKGEIFNATFRATTGEIAHLFTLYARALHFAALPIELSARREEAWYPFAIPDNIPKDFVFALDLTVGDRSIDVAYLQIILKMEELYYGDISGRFDQITRAAVLAFQERYLEEFLIPGGLNQPTGNVDFQTRANLNHLLEESPALFDIETLPGEQKESKKRTIVIAVIVTIGAVAGATAYIFRRKYTQ